MISLTKVRCKIHTFLKVEELRVKDLVEKIFSYNKIKVVIE